ncbi:MAG: hypothetical protein HKN35_02610 [Woeseia sp.]|nr:hypothetical protein [Woeseia sp.]
MIDKVSREYQVAVVNTSISRDRVARELNRIAEMRGFTCKVVSEIGTDPKSNAMLKWQEKRQAAWNCIELGNTDAKRLCRASSDACGVNASTSTSSRPCAMPAM